MTDPVPLSSPGLNNGWVPQCFGQSTARQLGRGSHYLRSRKVPSVAVTASPLWGREGLPPFPTPPPPPPPPHPPPHPPGPFRPFPHTSPSLAPLYAPEPAPSQRREGWEPAKPPRHPPPGAVQPADHAQPHPLPHTPPRTSAQPATVPAIPFSGFLPLSPRPNLLRNPYGIDLSLARFKEVWRA